ncbi:MAG: L,D-transpeptidase [Austwickia sp.]|nr:L,D-transpeptidase [Austwickia sp.]MCO5309071.1 L,D-transpeptidase [Austwickia sp.]
MRIRRSLRALAVTGMTAALTASGAAGSRAAAPGLDDHAGAIRATTGEPAAHRGAAALAAPSDLPAICRQQKAIICISKAARTLTYLDSGRDVMTAEVRFGRPGFETPTGTWKVDTKSPESWWSYPYRVYMPWGIKFDSRIGLYIHYSSGFALNPKTYIGSHGCVQIGDWETARTLHERTAVNTTVHIY